MNHKRQVNLNLWTLHFPIMAVVSILHRVTGIIVFVFVPGLLYSLDLSLSSETSFHHLQKILSDPMVKVACFLFLVSLSYHFLAGLRHLLMDLGIGDSKALGRMTAWSVVILALITAIGFWVRLWK